MSVERLQKLLAVLPDSGIPPVLAEWLAGGLEAWRAGDDLAESLELYRPTLNQRDGWIKMAIGLCPGESDTAKISFFIDCLDGHRQHPETTGQHLVERLTHEPVMVPRSIKQLLRILDGRRQDGWRGFGT